MLGSGGVSEQLRAGINDIAERLAGEVVERWSESASHDDGAMIGRELAHGARDFAAIIANGPPLARHGANGLQFARQPRGVGVFDLPKYQFVTDGEQRNTPGNR